MVLSIAAGMAFSSLALKTIVTFACDLNFSRAFVSQPSKTS